MTDAGAHDQSTLNPDDGRVTVSAPRDNRPSRVFSKRNLMIAVPILALLGVGFLALLALRNYEVVNEGRLLPYTGGKIYEVELFDRFTLYVEPDVRPSADVFNSYILVSISSMALLVLVFLHVAAPAASRKTKTFFLTLWLGMGYLAADELLAIHESLGHNLRFLADLPGIDRPDDAIIAFYAVPVLLFLVVFRDIILSSRRAVILLAAGIAVFVASAPADAIGGGVPKILGVSLEELLEPLSSLFVLAGFLMLAVDRLTIAFHESKRAGARPIPADRPVAAAGAE